LVDIRHKPSGQDVDMYHWIKTFGYDAIIVATKADKIARGQWERHMKIIREELEIVGNDFVVPFSSSKKINVDKLWDIFEPMLVQESIEE
jgi:GTP-binding protein